MAYPNHVATLLPHFASSRRLSTVDCRHRHVGTNLLQPQCPESTKESVEPTILSIITIEITHLTRFTLLLLLRIQRYIWRNHVASWAYTNTSDRNLELNKIRFSYVHYILQYNFWIGFESEKLKSLYWYSMSKRRKVTVWGRLPLSRYANTVLNHAKVSI